MTDDVRLCSTIAGLNLNSPVVLGQEDRRRHLYIIGTTGTGKSTLLLALIVADLNSKHGLALLDPHGDLAKSIIDGMPRDRIADAIYLDPADLDHPLGLNPLFGIPHDRRPLVAAHVVAAFRHIWMDSWGLETTETILIKENGGAEALCNMERKLFVKD